VESRPAMGARAGGGRTGPLAGARGGGDRRTGRRRRPEHGRGGGRSTSSGRWWPEHGRGGDTSVAVVAGARAWRWPEHELGAVGRRRPEHEQWGRAVRRPGGTATSVAATAACSLDGGGVLGGGGRDRETRGRVKLKARGSDPRVKKPYVRRLGTRPSDIS
jgi:hypothetical protein